MQFVYQKTIDTNESSSSSSLSTLNVNGNESIVTSVPDQTNIITSQPSLSNVTDTAEDLTNTNTEKVNEQSTVKLITNELLTSYKNETEVENTSKTDVSLIYPLTSYTSISIQVSEEKETSKILPTIMTSATELIETSTMSNPLNSQNVEETRIETTSTIITSAIVSAYPTTKSTDKDADDTETIIQLTTTISTTPTTSSSTTVTTGTTTKTSFLENISTQSPLITLNTETKTTIVTTSVIQTTTVEESKRTSTLSKAYSQITLPRSSTTNTAIKFQNQLFWLPILIIIKNN